MNKLIKLLVAMASYLLVPGFKIEVERRGLKGFWADESGFIGTTAAIIGASVLGAGASIISGNKAAKAQTQAADQASATQLQMFEEQKALNAPYRQKGIGALNLYSKIAVGGQTDLVNELPGIAFAREQGEQAINRGQAARGNYLSGAGIKEAIRYNQGLATTNYSTVMADLYRLIGIGQAAAANTGAAAIQTGQGIAQTQVAAGNARAAGAANIGSSINSGINNALFSYLYMNPATPSDTRLKENIKLVGYVDGLPIYKYNYRSKFGIDGEHIGPMAQDVEKTHPEAIIEINGYKHIDMSLFDWRPSYA